MKAKIEKKASTLGDLVGTMHGNTRLDFIPLIHPETGEKIYLIGNTMGEWWYRKIPGQAGADGQMWPLAQEPGFNLDSLKLHPDWKKEVALVPKQEEPKKKGIKWVPYHDDSPCSGVVALVKRGGGNYCPVCKIHPDSQSVCLIPYCPDCNVRLLEDGGEKKCPLCNSFFTFTPPQ